LLLRPCTNKIISDCSLIIHKFVKFIESILILLTILVFFWGNSSAVYSSSKTLNKMRVNIFSIEIHSEIKFEIVYVLCQHVKFQQSQICCCTTTNLIETSEKLKTFLGHQNYFCTQLLSLAHCFWEGVSKSTIFAAKS
jgi:hypothetical protein